jgi:hypothetical protein
MPLRSFARISVRGPFAIRFSFISRSLELFNDLVQLQEWALCYRKALLFRCDQDLSNLLPFLCACSTLHKTKTLRCLVNRREGIICRKPNMRSIISLTLPLICILLCMHLADATAFGRRQVDSSTFSKSSSATAPSTTASQSTGFPAIQSTSTTNVGPGSSDAGPSVSQSAITTPLSLNSISLSNTISHSGLATTIRKTRTPSTTAVSTAANGKTTTPSNPLPLKPKITPGLSITGIVLTVSGLAFLLIGIKNRSIQIFLSSAYLTSLSITVLIIYVMSPPVSSAIQGAYFVAAFMTGVLFGAGSLVFPEITEGLGCFLGGVCLSMWLLVLKPGGTLTGTVGKIVFVLVFGVAVWVLSFFRTTRPYGLIGATSFSGATAVVLGIDCFCRCGLKEFWLYIWNLNDNLFPLNTTTYPITRGMQVEIAAIVLGCIVGVISQLKLWKVIKDRREKKEVEQRDVERRKSAMEEARGRFLEARTDQEKAQWEKIYGPQWGHLYNDHVQGSRSTIVDSSNDLSQDNRKSWISTREMSAGSTESVRVEMNRLSLPRADHNFTSRSKRQSAVTVHTIPEDDETQAEISASTTDVQSASSVDGGLDHPSTSAQHNNHDAPRIPPLPFTIPTTASTKVSSVQPSPAEPNLQLAEKQKSDTSILKRLSSQNGIVSPMSHSEEALILPEAHHSRASSVAATLNDELEELDLRSVHSEAEHVSESHDRELTLHATPPTVQTSCNRLSYLGDEPPSPAALSIDFDPEELARPIMAGPEQSSKSANESKELGGSRSNFVRSNDLTVGKNVTATSGDANGSTSAPADLKSTESLTQGALVRVPSQLSNVVMTYRTNEWAKHISTAEVPVDDRRSSILAEAEAESPVQLVETPAPVRVEELGQTALNTSVATTEPASSKSAQAPARPDKRRSTVRRSLETHVAPARVTVDGKIHAPSLHRSFSDQSLAAAPTIVIRPPTSPSGQYTSLPPRLTRSSSTLSSAIVESTETQLPSSSPPVSGSPSPHAASTPLAAQTGKAPSGPHLERSASNLRGSTTTGPMVRSFSSESLSNHIYQQAAATASETRLSFYNSHQPKRRASTFVPGKRDSMLADWQGSLKHESSMTAIPKVTADQRRAEMVKEKRQSLQDKQRQEVTQQYREQVLDQAMRTTDMQALHREAMRKLQAKANKHI